MAMIDYAQKRTGVLLIMAIVMLSSISLFGIGDMLSGLIGFSLFGTLVVGDILAIVSLYFLYQIYRRKFG